MNNNKQKKDITETMKRDYVTNKLLLVFTLAFALLLYFVNIGRMFKSVDTFQAGRKLAETSPWFALAIILLGIIMLVVESIRKTDTSYKLFSGKNITVVGIVFAICALAISFVQSPSMFMLVYIFICALTVLYIVFYSYQREFFMIALSAIISGVAIWLLRSGLVNTAGVLVLALAALAILLLAVFTIVAHAKHGTLKLFGREVAIFAGDAKYALVYLTYAVSLALLAATFLAFNFALYYIFGLIGYIVLLGVYYTVKLI